MKINILIAGHPSSGRKVLYNGFVHSTFDNSPFERQVTSVRFDPLEDTEIEVLYDYDNIGSTPIDGVMIVADCSLLMSDNLEVRENYHKFITSKLEQYQNKFKLIVATKADLVQYSDKVEHEVKKRHGENVNFALVSDKIPSLIRGAFLNFIKFIMHNKNREIISDPKKLLVEKLENYTARIEKHTIQRKPDFAHGFWFFAKSRSINRKANYLLAKHLIQQLLNNIFSIEEIFKNIDTLRDAVLNVYKLKDYSDYIARGMNSSELKDIFKLAKTLSTSREPTIINNPAIN